MPATQISPATQSELRQLHFRLATTRAKLLATRISTGLATAACVLIGVFAAEMSLDWLVHLPWLARACFSLPALGGAGWILYQEVVLPLMRRPTDHAVACAIERAMPLFQTRLIASIQLGHEAAIRKSALVGALIRETAAMAAKADFRKAIETGKLLRALRLFFVIAVVAAGLGYLGRGNITLLLERALLLTTKLPSRTRIESVSSPSRLAAGEDLKIDVKAAGVLPDGGTVVADVGSKRSEYKLNPIGGGRFEAVIHSVPDSVAFTVHLGDAVSDEQRVTVLSPPAVLGVKCLQIFPAYTKLHPVSLPTGNLSLLAGSTLRITVSSSGPVKEGSIHLAGLEKDLPLKVDAANPAEPHGDIPVPKEGLTGFSLHLVDQNGIPSRETAVYRIDIVPDLPPTIKITHPGPEEVATANATEVIGFVADDDFGVAKVVLHYTVNGSTEKTIDFDVGSSPPRELVRRFDWKLANLKLAPGGIIDFWLEAFDANDVTGPGEAISDHSEIKIVTDDEKRTELTDRMNDALGTLDQVSQSEDDLSKKLGTQIFQKQEAK